MDDHLSSLAVAYHIKRISTCKRVTFCADLLAADRVYLHIMSPWCAVGFYPTRFTFSQ